MAHGSISVNEGARMASGGASVAASPVEKKACLSAWRAPFLLKQGGEKYLMRK